MRYCLQECLFPERRVIAIAGAASTTGRANVKWKRENAPDSCFTFRSGSKSEPMSVPIRALGLAVAFEATLSHDILPFTYTYTSHHAFDSDKASYLLRSRFSLSHFFSPIASTS